MMNPRGQVAVGLTLLLCLWDFAESGKLLVVPLDASPWLSMKLIIEKLAQRGHQIVITMSENTFLVQPINNVTNKIYPAPFTQEDLKNTLNRVRNDIFNSPPFLVKLAQVYEHTIQLTNLAAATCQCLLSEEKLIKFLQEQNFDAVLVDPMRPCGLILAEYLSLPSVFFLRGLPCSMDFEAAMCPTPWSYIPQPFTAFSDHMTFSERVKNALMIPFNVLFCHLFVGKYGEIATEFLQRKTTVSDLLRNGSIWLLRHDFVFEYPKPVMPNMVFVGGINCAQKKPLSEEFEAIVTKSDEHGIVVFSLGTLVSEIPDEKAMEIAEALGTIPQTVVWRYTGKAPPNLAENTKLFKWLPQNDLLGMSEVETTGWSLIISSLHNYSKAHPKTRAFITHGGISGVYEGICSAVPMVLMPLFLDQMDNAKRVESRGAGVVLNLLEMTSKDLSEALKSVIHNKSYKENIQRLSELHLDRPIQPLDLAVHWVEFVMRHKGAPHLRPAAHNLNWIQYHSIDVVAFLLAVGLLVLFISLKCCLFCCRKCFCRSGRMSKKSKSKSQ